MRSFRQSIIIPVFVLLLSGPAFAYQLAMRNGSVVQFEKYHVENGKLIYTDGAGKEVGVSLEDVDMERTKTLNADEKPPLDLPWTAAAPAANTASDAGEPESLADAARAMRAQGKAHPASANRKYTSDDVTPAGSGDGPTLTTTTGEKKEAAEGETEQGGSEQGKTRKLSEQDWSEFYDLDREQTARAVLEYANLPADTLFPDRAEWEFRLFEAKQDWVHAHMQVREHPQDEAEHQQYLKAWNQFASIANEGIEKACHTLPGCRLHPS